MVAKKHLVSRGLFRLAMVAAVVLGASAASAQQWYKGNTHTHTWWSDGDSPPDLVVKWYREHGYNFLVLSDHNILSQGEKWVKIEKRRAKGAENYENTFPKEWIVKREANGEVEYRLKTLDELKARFEEPGTFMMIQGEEISDSCNKKPIHLNGVNLKELVPPQGGKTIVETMQRDIDAVLAQRKATGQPMFPHINHPNFGWAITPEELMQVRGEHFFEIHNGHSGVRNYGNKDRPSAERMWDIVLTRRLAELKLPIMFGLATDDAHGFTGMVPGGSSNPGRGWVMVRAAKLTPEEIVLAMERGDFYPTTGVVLREISFKDNTLSVEVEPRDGVSYTIQFIGTMRRYDRTVTTRPAEDGFVAYEYSKDLGKVLAEQAGTHASYRLTGDELYVRAKVVSTAKHPNPFAVGDVEVAWTQPVQPGSREVTLK